MTTNSRKWLWPSLAVLVAGAVVLIVVLKKSDSETSVTLNCMKLTRDQISNYWMASIRNADTAKFNPQSSPAFTLRGYLSSSAGISLPQTEIDLTDGTNCTVTLASGTVFNLNQVQLTGLGLLDGTGSLVEFDYLKFMPEDTLIDRVNYLYFSIYMVDRNGVEQFKIKSDPCPPLCPKPPVPPQIPQ